MRTFQSGFADLIIAFISYREASGSWNNNYEENLHLFDRFCAENYPEGSSLSQDMINTWCAKRDTELNRTCETRIRVIKAFINYLRERDLSEAQMPKKLKKEPKSYIPHAFTPSELQRFFIECDRVPVYKSLSSKVCHITCPALFRLLYSSGIRTTEARLLQRKDFDPTEGILNIQKSKGYDQHYVALHESMTSLLILYDQAANKLQPNRTYFPDVVPYALRHNYAIENINGWSGNNSFDLNEHLLYLSKSMGHRNISSTLYYYSIVPCLADMLLEKTESGFNKIVREVDYEEE